MVLYRGGIRIGREYCMDTLMMSLFYSPRVCKSVNVCVPPRLTGLSHVDSIMNGKFISQFNY